MEIPERCWCWTPLNCNMILNMLQQPMRHWRGYINSPILPLHGWPQLYTTMTTQPIESHGQIIPAKGISLAQHGQPWPPQRSVGNHITNISNGKGNKTGGAGICGNPWWPSNSYVRCCNKQTNNSQERKMNLNLMHSRNINTIYVHNPKSTKWYWLRNSRRP